MRKAETVTIRPYGSVESLTCPRNSYPAALLHPEIHQMEVSPFRVFFRFVEVQRDIMMLYSCVTFTLTSVYYLSLRFEVVLVIC